MSRANEVPRGGVVTSHTSPHKGHGAKASMEIVDVSTKQHGGKPGKGKQSGGK